MTAKIADSDSGLVFTGANGALVKCDRPICALSLATDAFPWHYAIAAVRLPCRFRSFRNGKEVAAFDQQIRFLGEMKERQTDGFAVSFAAFLKRFRVARTLIHGGEEDARRLRKLCGGFAAEFLELPERLENAATKLNDWFGRRRRDGSPALIFDQGCSEFLGGAYHPARACVIAVLNFYDERSRFEENASPRKKLTRGY